MYQLQLVPKRDCTLASYLESRGLAHVQFARAIGRAYTEEVTYERILFALLSTNTAFDATCEAFRIVCRAQEPKVDWTCDVSLSDILSSVRTERGQTVAFPNVKARDIVDFTRRFDSHPSEFVLQDNENASQWRARVSIRGLAYMKLSFAGALLAPETADTICVDRHIQRFLYGRETRAVNTTAYTRAEESLARVGARYGMGAFVTQWTIWDWLRAKEEPHDILV